MTAVLPGPTAGQWLAGARPRTLPAAVTPVIAASGLAAFDGAFALVPALLALVVSLALQVGVNYANDYSDGIRGTDRVRVGPLRLVGSGLAAPKAVRRAALVSFAIAAVAGLALVIITRQWWLLGVGIACVLAAWFYTGGKRPYGYLGLGELFVFVFFGVVAVCGTYYVQAGQVSLPVLLTERRHRRPDLRHPGRQQPARHRRRRRGREAHPRHPARRSPHPHALSRAGASRRDHDRGGRGTHVLVGPAGPGRVCS